jgi:hypothetical protein
MSMMMDSPSNPTPVSTLSMSGTLSSRLRDTQTSMMGRRASRRRDAGSRKAWEDARVPIRRVRRERAEMKCMSPWVEGRSLRAQRYNEREGCVGEDGKSKVEGSRVSYTFPVNNSGQNSQDPVSHASHVRTTVWRGWFHPLFPTLRCSSRKPPSDQIQYRQRVDIKTLCLTRSLVCRRGSKTG